MLAASMKLLAALKLLALLAGADSLEAIPGAIIGGSGDYTGVFGVY